MKLTRTIAFGMIAATLGFAAAGSAAHAQTLRDAQTPAEFPPASFKGKQYVDSRGCIYIRAGIDGKVNWVPRVTRSRKVLCGYQPTFAKAGGTAKPAANPTAPTAVPAPEAVVKAPAVRPAPEPVAKAVAKPVARPKAKPKPTAAARKVKRVAAAPKPKPKPKASAAVSVAAAQPAPLQTPKTGRILGAKPYDVPQPRPGTSCAGYTGMAKVYGGNNAKETVRCGAQTEGYVTVVARKPVTVIRDGKKVVVEKRVLVRRPAATTGVASPSWMRKKRAATTAKAPVGATPGTTVSAQSLAPGTRVVPRHVWEAQQAAKVTAPVPKGYRPVWTDGRLNPKRAHQTVEGIAATDLAWTRTVPRKLYIRETGLVVTHLYPGLKYPYYSYAEMQAAGYDVSPNGPLVEAGPARTKRLVRKYVRSKSLKTQVATKSAPGTVRSAKKPAASVKGRYVQVGTFANPANAERSAARLAGIGLPARYGTLVRGKKRYRVVLAGPFAPGDLKAALGKARRAGFSDAFVR